jgi:hypothetical protein
LDAHDFGKRRARPFWLMRLDDNGPAVLEHHTRHAADARLME